jgi:hypothetical protein
LDLDFCFLCVPPRPQRETNIVVLAPALPLAIQAKVAYPILDKWLFLPELCHAFVKSDRTEIPPFVYTYD